MRSALGLALAGLACLGLAGCGGGGSTLSGTVTYEGQPVKEGYVTLVPADGRGSLVGGPIKDGRFRLTGLKPGKVQLRVTSSPVSPSGPVSYADLDRLDSKREGPPDRPRPSSDVVPADAVNNNQEMEIQPGVQALEVKLLAPPR